MIRPPISYLLGGLLLLFGTEPASFSAQSHSPPGMVRIASGFYTPFFAAAPSKRTKSTATPSPPIAQVQVSTFWMDRLPVTNQEFREFVRANPEWSRSRIKPIFADGRYLDRWSDDLTIRNSKEAKSPVTHVSWFAAQAYCEWKGKSLPSVDQWEYAAADRKGKTSPLAKQILAWYGEPTPAVIPNVGRSPANSFGLHDMHGLIWEWTLDFNSAMQTQDAREDGTKDNNLFCGSGSLGALDPTDYVSFMRFSFRNSLKANYTVANLGFRCVRENSHD